MTAIVSQADDGRPVYGAECAECDWSVVSPSEWYVTAKQAEHEASHRPERAVA